MSTVLERRVTKLEDVIGTSELDLAYARELVLQFIELDVIDKPDDIERLVREYAKMGLTDDAFHAGLRVCIAACDGKSRGLPNPREIEWLEQHDEWRRQQPARLPITSVESAMTAYLDSLDDVARAMRNPSRMEVS